jgi:hypothetical protein
MENYVHWREVGFFHWKSRFPAALLALFFVNLHNIYLQILQKFLYNLVFIAAIHCKQLSILPLTTSELYTVAKAEKFTSI